MLADKKQMTFYCDSTDLASLTSNFSDTIIIGGYLINKAEEESLLELVAQTKKELISEPLYPVKWNLKDTKGIEMGGLTPLNITRTVSETLRSRLLDVLISCEATIFISIIQSYSNRKEITKKTRKDLIHFSFSNLLMRVGAYAKKFPNFFEIVLDWPENDNRRPFVEEYVRGWRDGITDEVPYLCGPLSTLGFTPSLLFGVTPTDPRLQLADLVVGSAREFIDYAFGKKDKDKFGVQQFRKLIPQFCTPIIGRGITVAPANQELSNTIFSALKKVRMP